MSHAASGRAAPPPRKGAGATISRGTVIRIDRAKGFGFLIDLAGEQRFFHRSAVLDDGFPGLKEQQAVDFEPLADERGARAINVRPAGSASRPTKPAQRSQPSSKATKAPAWRSDLSPFRNGTGAPTPGRKR